LKPSGKVQEFSKEFWGEKVDIYYSGLQGVLDNHWSDLLVACGTHSSVNEDSDDETHDADLSLLDHNHALIFDFCSPTKS
jgi:hypothetical protein